MPKLGVNIDHVATLREARRGLSPDPLKAAIACEEAGCDSIVCHLREDRRHIKDADVAALKAVIRTRFNLEMSVAPDIVAIACRIKPDQATLVPERRLEITTEGGLDVCGNFSKVKSVTGRLESRGIRTSVFINPVRKQIEAAAKAGASIIELHTGEYANTASIKARRRNLAILESAVAFAVKEGLEVNAGHGLDYENVTDVARIGGINELNIGHSIISRAIFVGIERAVREMVELVRFHAQLSRGGA